MIRRNVLHDYSDFAPPSILLNRKRGDKWTKWRGCPIRCSFIWIRCFSEWQRPPLKPLPPSIEADAEGKRKTKIRIASQLKMTPFIQMEKQNKTKKKQTNETNETKQNSGFNGIKDDSWIFTRSDNPVTKKSDNLKLKPEVTLRAEKPIMNLNGFDKSIHLKTNKVTTNADSTT